MRVTRRRILLSALGAAGGVLLPVSFSIRARAGENPAALGGVEALIPVFVESSEFERRLAHLSTEAALTQLYVGIVGVKPSGAALRAFGQAPSWAHVARQLVATPAFQAARVPEVTPPMLRIDTSNPAVLPLLTEAAQVRRLYLGFLAREPDQWELGMSLSELASLRHPANAGPRQDLRPKVATGTTSVRSIDAARVAYSRGHVAPWTTEPARWMR